MAELIVKNTDLTPATEQMRLVADRFASIMDQMRAAVDEHRSAPGADSTGAKFRETILSKGSSRDYAEAYRAFRGRDKDTRPLLERRGLAGTDA